jgi:hypothetical protein
MYSKVNSVYKYELVLSTFKLILLKSASLFSFLATDTLTNDGFVKWFFAT